MTYSDEAKSSNPTNPNSEVARSVPSAPIESAFGYAAKSLREVDRLLEDLYERLLPVMASGTEEDDKSLQMRPLDKNTEPSTDRVRHPSKIEMDLDDLSSIAEHQARVLRVIHERLSL